MDCTQARQLFDAYLDGELSSALATELGAHRLHCSDCRRALALLEVSEHILTLDREPVSLDADFSDRLVACVALREASWSRRLGRWFYVAGPVAAAAVIGLAFLGFFDGKRTTEVAGDRVVAQNGHEMGTAFDAMPDAATSSDSESAEQGLDAIFGRMQDSIESKVRSVESLQTAIDRTLQQPLQLLEKARANEKKDEQVAPALEKPGVPATPVPASPVEEFEDL